MRITKISTYITIALIIFTGYHYLTIESNIKDIKTNSIELTGQDNTTYLEYCEGGFSNQKAEKSSDICIADYPGVFSKNILIFLSILMIFVTAITAGIQRPRK